jgi:hypothetical protein
MLFSSQTFPMTKQIQLEVGTAVEKMAQEIPIR